MPIKNNSFFYPSVSGSVILSELLPLPSLINNLKVRGSWSRVSKGQISSDPYSYIQAYQTGTNWNGNNPSLYLGGQLINPNLEPETSDTWETGLTLGLLKNSLSLDVAYYQARDYNNLISNPVSEASGYTSVLVNGNEYKRKGLEFTIKATPVQTDAFQWNLMTNLSSYHRYLTEIYGGAKTLNRLHVGDRTDRIYANVYTTDPKGNIIFKDNGYPQDDSFARFVGYNDPDWNYGLQNRFSYHQFALEASIDGRIGGRIYSTVDQKMWWGGKHPGSVNQYRDDANNGKSTYVGDGVVVTDGKVTYDDEGNILNDTREFAPNKTAINYIAFMKSTSNSMNEHYFYYDATFMKLREVTFTYNFPQKWLDHFFLNNASVSLIGRNLWLWSNMKNVDPDTGSGNVQAPSTRNFGLNINVSF